MGQGETALNSVLQTPASASIGDWGLTLLVGLILINLVIMLFRAAFPRRRFRRARSDPAGVSGFFDFYCRSAQEPESDSSGRRTGGAERARLADRCADASRRTSRSERSVGGDG